MGKYNSACSSLRPGQLDRLGEKIKDTDISERKIRAFDWIEKNADELSIEWTGSHHHIYSGNEGNLERVGSGRKFIDAIEDCYT